MSMDIIPRTPFERLAPLRRNYNKRIMTFDQRWPPGVPVSPRDLAKDGFYYTGIDDKVQCTHCGGILSGWCEGDIVALEHRQHFPNCPWVKHGSLMLEAFAPTIPTYNVEDLAIGQPALPIGESYEQYQKPSVPGPKFQNYAMESARKASFRGWPTQRTLRPDDLCKAGFFYLGEGDKCRCFYCGNTLLKWDPEDDPLLEHAKWFPDCAWLKLKINTVQHAENSFGPVEQDERMLHASRATNQPHEQTRTNLFNEPKVTSQPLTTEDESAERKKLNEILRENENLKEQRLCKICLDEDAGVLFEPCGHICCCSSCGVPLQQCPICRTSITNIIKAYIS